MLNFHARNRVFIGLAFLSLFSCRHAGDTRSQLKIANGIEIKFADENEYTKPVVMLREPMQDGSYRGFCTSTFVNDTTAISALHCIQRGNGTSLPHVKVGNQYIQAINSFYDKKGLEVLVSLDKLAAADNQLNKDFFLKDQQCRESFGGGDIQSKLQQNDQLSASLYPQLPPLDLAILVYPKGTGDLITGGGGYYGVAAAPVKINDEVRFIGFGHNTSLVKAGIEQKTCRQTVKAEGFGKKRKGTNKLSLRTSSSTLVINGYRNQKEAEKKNAGLGEKISVAPGDSGGPWIACGAAAECKSFELIGVNSTGGFSNGSKNSANGVPLLSAASRATMKRAIQCEEADKSRCAANFKGSGIAPVANTPTLPSNANLFMKVLAGTAANAVNIEISVPATAANVYFCVGADYQKCDQTVSKPLSNVRAAQGASNKIYRINGAINLLETAKNSFSIVGRDAQGLMQHGTVLEIAKK